MACKDLTVLGPPLSDQEMPGTGAARRWNEHRGLLLPIFFFNTHLSGVAGAAAKVPLNPRCRRPYRTRPMKCLTIVCLSALLTLSAVPDAFAWGAVAGTRGGAAYRGPMGGAAVRTPSGAAAVRGPYGGAAARGPYGGTAYRAPGYGGGAVYRGPVYGGTVYRPGVGAGVAVGAAAGVAVGAAAGAAAASTYPSCYYPPYYCYPPPYYQPPAW
jgi:hypothetical protein